MIWRRLQFREWKWTPFARAQLGWAVLLLALMGMLELANDLNLAYLYFLLCGGYFSTKYHPIYKFSQPYWIIDIILALAAVYIFVRFILNS